MLIHQWHFFRIKTSKWLKMFKEGIDKVNMLLKCNMGLLVIRNNESGEKKNKAGITLQ